MTILQIVDKIFLYDEIFLDLDEQSKKAPTPGWQGHVILADHSDDERLQTERIYTLQPPLPDASLEIVRDFWQILNIYTSVYY